MANVLYAALGGGPDAAKSVVATRVILLLLLAVGAAFSGAAIAKHWAHFSNDAHTRDVVAAYLRAHTTVNITDNNAILAGDNLISVDAAGASININGTDAILVGTANGTGIDVSFNYHGGDGVVITNTKTDDYYSAILLVDPQSNFTGGFKAQGLDTSVVHAIPPTIGEFNTYWKSDGEGGASFDYVDRIKHQQSGGSQVRASGGYVTVTALGFRIDPLVPGTASGQLSLTAASGTTVTISPAPGTSTTHGYILPPDNGDADQVLGTDGEGNLTWVDLPTGPGDPLVINATSITTVNLDSADVTYVTNITLMSQGSNPVYASVTISVNGVIYVGLAALSLGTAPEGFRPAVAYAVLYHNGVQPCIFTISTAGEMSLANANNAVFGGFPSINPPAQPIYYNIA